MSATAIGIVIFTSLLLLVASQQPGYSQFLDWECGLRSAPVAYGTRIINGSKAGMTSSPWMAFIVTKDNFFICGGSLITNRLVLTAAHCYHKYKHLKVILGEYDIDSADDECHETVTGDLYCTSRVELNVDTGIMHPGFNSRTVNNDIAILRLARRVEYTGNIRPICIVLDKSWRNYIDGMDTLTATGWGHTRAGGNISRILQTLQIRRQLPEVCGQYVGKTPSHNEFCVGNWDSGLCNGDSGGPLGKLIPYGERPRFIQVGVTSLANKRCNYASVSTDVLSHVDWIVRVEERYGHEYTQPVQVWSSSGRYVPTFNIKWPIFDF